MNDLRSNLTKGLIAAVCCALAIAAGAVSARQEAQAQGVRATPQHTAPVR